MKEKIIQTLLDARFALLQLQDDFFIFGSAALVLAGVNLEQVGDIDICTSKRDAEILKKLWADKDKQIDSSPSERFRSNHSVYRFNDIDIDVAGGLEVKTNGAWQTLLIDDYLTFSINELSIKIPTLEEQKRILTLFGREKDIEKIKLIEKHITKKT